MPYTKVLLVDMGYLFMYRMTATMKNLRYSGEPTPDQLLNAMLKHIDSQLKKIIKIKQIDKIVFCKDAYQKDVWRHDIIDGYKATRPVATTFIRLAQERIYNVVKQFGPLFEVPRLEADDIIALSVRSIRKLFPNVNINITVLANDSDMFQLGVPMIDATGKAIQGQNNLMIKILMGDKSDNIPAIAKGVGKKTAEKLAADADALEAFLEKDPERRKVFELNRKVITFDEIPIEYVHKFNTLIQIKAATVKVFN